MRGSFKHFSSFALLAATAVFVSCGDDGPTQPETDIPQDPVVIPIAPEPDDATIPPIPTPNSSQVVAILESEPGEPVFREPYENDLQATVVGRYQLKAICGRFAQGESDACEDESGNEVFYDNRRAAFRTWLRSTGATFICGAEVNGETDPNVFGPLPDIAFAPVATECITFHLIKPDLPVFLQHDRLWLNLTSRLLGPGTTYSVTYRWVDGVETSNGFEWGQTSGSTSLTEETWENCIEGSVKTKATASFDAGFAKGEASIEAELRDEFCFGGKNAEEVSQSITQTNTSRNTVTSERGGEETTTVAGADGVDRIYTVWQLQNQYSYVTSDGTHIQDSNLSDDSAFDTLVNQSSPPSEWQPVDVIWPNNGSIRQGTNFFAQQTRDFAIPGSSAIVDPMPSVRFFEQTPQL